MHNRQQNNSLLRGTSEQRLFANLKLRLNTCINPQSATLAVAGKWQGLFNITECLAKKKE
jgi:hypothetical protein